MRRGLRAGWAWGFVLVLCEIGRGADGVAVSARDEKKLAERALDAPPVFDGMIAAAGRLFVALKDGSLVCLAGEDQ